jgi:5-methylcytosine-specific restriction endonuclease McrA
MLCACGCGETFVPRNRKSKYATKQCQGRHTMRLRRAKGGHEPTPLERMQESVWWLQGDPCSYCGELGGSIDHIVPRLEGRTWSLKDPWNQWPNLTSACKSCNNSKRQKSLLGFLYARKAREDVVQIARGHSVGLDETIGTRRWHRRLRSSRTCRNSVIFA